MSSVRLNRYMSVSGAAARRKGEILIRDGRVTVNGAVVTDPAFSVSTGDAVMLDGKPLILEARRRYYVLNKPTGVIVSRGDTHGRATVFDLFAESMDGIFPVGRLDEDTSGVLLLTDDGDLAYRLTHPSYGVEKVYRAEVEGEVSAGDIRRTGEGIVLDDGPASPARMIVLSIGSGVSLVEIVLHEGRKRQVRRMMERLGHPVRVLERISFGGITAKHLPLGSFRPLTGEEIEHLHNESCMKRSRKRNDTP
ncbi:rRNA pseudouridine synthase [bacterium]|nr:rRNA pseudouridine synthase [bacterium]